MKKLRQGDVVFNYADKCIRGVSIIKNNPYNFTEVELDRWEKDGTRADINHFMIDEIAIDVLKGYFQEFKNALRDVTGPFDINGDVKQGYLFEFNYEAAKIIRAIYGKPFPNEIEKYFADFKNGSKIPQREDIERAEAELRKTSDEVVKLEDVLKHIEKTYEDFGIKLQDDWREITKRNVEIWFGYEK